MGLLGDLTAYIDARKRVAARNARDVASSPGGMLGMWGDQVREDLTSNMQQMGAGVTDRSQLGQSIAAAMGPAGNAPMGLLGHTVYHGSPHKFDKFDASKIGTGEGAQAYGHGLYFAERPTAAASYRNVGADETRNLERGVSAELSKPNPNMEWVAAARDRIAQRKGAGLDADVYGNLYKVDIPDEWLPKMLDWDKPLSQQPETFARLKEAGIINDKSPPYQKSGKATPAALLQMPGEVQSITQQLVDAGIPGVRYLDGGSRSAGDGTYSYVVFPGMEGLLKILERQ